MNPIPIVRLHPKENSRFKRVKDVQAPFILELSGGEIMVDADGVIRMPWEMVLAVTDPNNSHRMIDMQKAREAKVDANRTITIYVEDELFGACTLSVSIPPRTTTSSP